MLLLITYYDTTFEKEINITVAWNRDSVFSITLMLEKNNIKFKVSDGHGLLNPREDFEFGHYNHWITDSGESLRNLSIN